MKRMITTTMMVAVGTVLAADITYNEPPADKSMIRVEGGTTTVAGLEAYSHLTHYWSFDDEENPFADSVGNISLQAVESEDPVWKSGEDDARRNGAIWTGKGLRAASNFIDGLHPYTICFWYKYGDFSAAGSLGQESILHIGKIPAGNAQIDTAPYLRVSHHNAREATKIDLWNNQVNYANSLQSSFVQGTWHHLALTCEVIEKDGCTTSNRLTVCMDGRKLSGASRIVAQQEFEPTDNFYLGMGYHWQKSERPVADATFDEVMCFDRVLTPAELTVFAQASRPVDFSAGWDVAKDGMLNLYGDEPFTALKGEGVVQTIGSLQLVPTSNAWFAGSIQAPALTYAGATAVTQTLSGVNAYAGATTVSSGTLEIAASPVQVFGEALVAWYPFEDPSDLGRDFSPRGNHLVPGGNCVYGSTAANAPFVGAGQNLAFDNEVQDGFYSKADAQMDGFGTDDNSFTVSLWMRGVAHSKDVGSFFFETSDAPSGIICRDPSGLRVGDSGNAIPCPMSEPWASGNWHHWALVYDAVAAKRIDEGATDVNCYYLFLDGICVKAVSTHNKAIRHAAGRFFLGRGFAGSGGPFKGSLDEVIVLNTGDPSDVAKLYALRRTQPETATSVLPSTTTLTVAEGATLKLTAVNETVAELYGTGTINLSGNAKLTVTNRDRFDGKVMGGQITDAPGAERRGMCVIVR